jgi:hypothetical protein
LYRASDFIILTRFNRIRRGYFTWEEEAGEGEGDGEGDGIGEAEEAVVDVPDDGEGDGEVMEK